MAIVAVKLGYTNDSYQSMELNVERLDHFFSRLTLNTIPTIGVEARDETLFRANVLRFPINSFLVKLQLKGVVIDGLFKKLCSNDSLKTLELSDLFISLSDAIDLSDYLKDAKVLESLKVEKSLYFLNLEKVVEGLQHSKSIRYLDIDELYAYDDCKMAIIQLIKINRSIKELKFPAMRMPDPVPIPVELGEALLSNLTLQKVTFRDTDSTFQRNLYFGLKRSKTLCQVGGEEEGCDPGLVRARLELNKVLQQNQK